MLRRLAVKRLTESDLTLFEWHFRQSASNQKAINLNADVFIDELYPGLPHTPSVTGGTLPLDLFIYGPGMEGEYNLQRKIMKGATYKNWRLDGEFIYGPPEDEDRFNVLTEGDLVVFEFLGDTRPESARAAFIGSGVPEDHTLYGAFDRVVGMRPSMVSLTPVELARLAGNSGVRDDHPIFGLVSVESDLEVVELGDRSEATGLRSAPSGRRVPRNLLQRARGNAERVGDLGEQFINSHLTEIRKRDEIENFEWVSLENAGSPYDFRIHVAGERVLADAKATELDFESRLHVSLGELRQMGYGSERYDLYRVFEMGETSAKLRIARDMRGWARSVVEVLKDLPEGVLPEGVTVSPSILTFEQEIEVSISQEPEEPEEQTLFDS